MQYYSAVWWWLRSAFYNDAGIPGSSNNNYRTMMFIRSGNPNNFYYPSYEAPYINYWFSGSEPYAVLLGGILVV